MQMPRRTQEKTVQSKKKTVSNLFGTDHLATQIWSYTYSSPSSPKQALAKAIDHQSSSFGRNVIHNVPNMCYHRPESAQER
jgi:hypothetical protein